MVAIDCGKTCKGLVIDLKTIESFHDDKSVHTANRVLYLHNI